MYTDDTGYPASSDYMVETIEKKWTQLLLNWVNKCVHPKTYVARELNARSIVETINKYKQDMRVNEINTDIMSCDDIEELIRYKYPLLRLRSFNETKETSRKMFLLHSIVLYHCCVTSEDGLVDSDICSNLSKFEQDIILKFCEILTDMEVTAHNIELAIKDTYNSVKEGSISSKTTDQYQLPYKMKLDRQPLQSSSSAEIITASVNYIATDTSSVNTVIAVTSSTGTIKKKFKTKPNLSPNKSIVSKFVVKPAKSKIPYSLPDKYSNNSKAFGKSSKKNLKKIFDIKLKSNKSRGDIKVRKKLRRRRLRRRNPPKFKSSLTVLPSTTMDDDENSKFDIIVSYDSRTDLNKPIDITKSKLRLCGYDDFGDDDSKIMSNVLDSACERGSLSGDAGDNVGEDLDSECMDTGDMESCQEKKFDCFCEEVPIFKYTACLLIVIITTGIAVFLWHYNKTTSELSAYDEMDKSTISLSDKAVAARMFQINPYKCKEGICEKVYGETTEFVYRSLSRCILHCMGPQVWPYPIGFTRYGKQLVVVGTSKLEYKFQSVPSDAVRIYLAEAFKLFLGGLAKLERYTSDTRSMNISKDAMIRKMVIQMDVESDPNPHINLDTDESYTINVGTELNQVMIKLYSVSYCGMRHALETLGQLILLDQFTGNLITLSDMIIKDGPSYKYRGLMIDTGRNYIPVRDIMRTIDAMASVKLNTFHWRISDVTSFPLKLRAIPMLFEHGSYSRSLVYTQEDVKKIVKKAAFRGIRVLLEVAAPGPVGRAWSWMSETTCSPKEKNYTCTDPLCLKLGTNSTVFDILQIIYTEILEMTHVNDMFHLSDSVFSLTNCFHLMDDREIFLKKALERLKIANNGVLPKLPIVWYTTHLRKDVDAKIWDSFGVQTTKWQPNPSGQFLSSFKVIQSSRWDLSCELSKHRCNKYKTWQDMYAWRSWKRLEALSIMGGEAVLWTDLVDSGNIDYHLWPRAAAVAERLWSDASINGSASCPVYVRLDSHRWRMLLKSVQVQPIWPLYCSFSPETCLQKIKLRQNNYFREFYFQLSNSINKSSVALEGLPQGGPMTL